MTDYQMTIAFKNRHSRFFQETAERKQVVWRRRDTRDARGQPEVDAKPPLGSFPVYRAFVPLFLASYLSVWILAGN